LCTAQRSCSRGDCLRKDLASASAADQPIVAYNISFDWNRALEPEYARLGLPPAGCRGFCAMTLARRVITGTENFKLESRR
jgi:DNA polymerase III epsilon subunit-like protein